MARKSARKQQDLPVVQLLDNAASQWDDMQAVAQRAAELDNDGDSSVDRSLIGGSDYVGDGLATLRDWHHKTTARRLLPESQSSPSSTGRTALLPKRKAQVVQGTQLPLDQVLNLLTSPDFFPRRSAFRLRPESLHDTDGEQVLTGTMRMALGPLRRQIQLRLYPTPSGNLTVLELLPKRRWMPQTRRFLRAGVPTITKLTDKLEQRAESGLFA